MSWVSGVPCIINQEGFTRTPFDGNIAAASEHPAGRSVRVWSYGPETWTGTFRFRTRANYLSFLTWGRVDRSGWSTDFALPNPFGSPSTYTARFFGPPPTATNVFGDVWDVPFVLRVWT